MSEMKTKILPVLPLGNGVLLPNMVVPLALETSDAKAAATAARGADGVLIVVARVKGTYAPVGCVAKLVNTGRGRQAGWMQSSSTGCIERLSGPEYRVPGDCQVDVEQTGSAPMRR